MTTDGNTFAKPLQAETGQPSGDPWFDYWQTLSPERREKFIRRRIAEVEKRTGAIDAREAWTLAAWRQEAASPFHRSMRETEEIRLAIRAAGATREAFPADDRRAGPEHTNGVESDRGRLAAIGDADEFCGRSVESTPDYQFLRRTLEETVADMVDTTGATVSPDKKAARDRERQALRDQSHKIAAALESQGVPAYRNTAWHAWRVYVHTQHVETVPPFRNIALLPYAAARNRQNLLAALEWFLQRNPFCRFWTFTTGPRCTVVDLARRVAWLHRRISQLNAAPFMVAAGAEIVFRATEFGTLEEKPADVHAGAIDQAGGVTYYHPHAHCVLYLSRGPLPRWQWLALGQQVKRFWRHHWDGGKIVGSAREVVKYVTKPGDMVRLATDNPRELRRLFEALNGKHLVQTLGTLRRDLSAMRAAGLELRKRWTPDGAVWQERRAINRCLYTGTFEDRECTQRKRTVAGVVASDAAFKRLFTLDASGPQTVETADLDVCRVVSVSMPAAGPLNVREPVVCVIGTRLDLAAVMREPIVARIVQETRDDFAAGVMLARAEQAGGRSIRVHTGTTTVTPERLPGFHDLPERIKPPAPPVWAPAAA